MMLHCTVWSVMVNDFQFVKPDYNLVKAKICKDQNETQRSVFNTNSYHVKHISFLE